MTSNFTKTINFSFKELRIFLFKKKICPVCNAKLKRKDKNYIAGEGWKKGVVDLPSSLNFHYGKHYRKTIQYNCASCQKVFSLSEL